MLQSYRDNLEILQRSKDSKGRSLTVHECEGADPSQLGAPDKANEVVASYANFLLVNGAVMVPKFGQEGTDQNALALFKSLFPDREVVQVPLNMLPRCGGGIHCATQQVPA
jgi:agmatine deiminase